VEALRGQAEEARAVAVLDALADWPARIGLG